MAKKYEILEQKMCKEIEKIEERLKNGQEMTMDDLKKLDMLYHALKSKATYDAMKEAEEYEGVSGSTMPENNQNGMSGYRGRAMNGRFVSRDAGNSYSAGYERGYSDAMNSGHYPTNMMENYYEPRRW